jgi:hypothetical protein
MTNIIMKYTVKKDKLKEAKDLSKWVMTQIQAREKGANCVIYREDDTYSFIQIVSFIDEKSQQKYESAKWMKEFIDRLYPICKREPTYNTMEKI